MRRLVQFIVLALIVATAVAGPPEGYRFLPFDQAMQSARDTGKRLFLYVGRQGCPTCEQTNRESFTDPAVHKAYSDHYVLAYVDSEGGRRLTLLSGERVTEMDLNARLGVVGTPTFFLLEPDATPILKRPGFQSAADFLLYDRFVREGHYRSQSFAQFRDSLR